MQPRALPPAGFLAALIAVSAAAALPLGEWPPAPWSFFGLVPLVFGLALALAAERQFVRAGTPVRPFKEPTALVTGAAFRFSRNPMSLGLVVVLAGAALLLSSPLALLVAPVYGLGCRPGSLHAKSVSSSSDSAMPTAPTAVAFAGGYSQS